MPYWILLLLVGLQRLTEIIISKRHAAWMRQHGGMECGRTHYPWVVLLMVGFFVAIPIEWYVRQTEITLFWPWLVGIFLLTQALRYWAMSTLGQQWNVRIWVIPGAQRIAKGPYRFLRHPNYLVVIIEFLVIPAIAQCYVTMGTAVLLYLWFLKTRIPAEERALALLKR